MTETLQVICILLAAVAVSEWLARYGIGRKIGGAAIVIIAGAVLSNTGILPRAADAPPVYGVLVSVGAPVSIFLLLIEVHLAALRRAGAPMLAAFALGAFGTLVGVVTAAWLTGAGDWLGEFEAPVTGMYVATYIGGGANFNALALHYGIVDEPLLFAGANAVDNVFTTIWMAVLLILPPLLRRMLPARTSTRIVDPELQLPGATALAAQRPDLLSMSTLLAIAFAAYFASAWSSAWLEASLGWSVPSILVLTTLALIAAQVPAVHRLAGAQVLAMYGSYLFLCVIGAYCDFAALAGLGRLALLLTLFVGLAIALHGLIVFGTGALLKADPDILAIASTANIAGSTTVLPLAQSLNRMELLLPGILVASLGNGIGTYVGFAVVALLSG
jgi:uncharacterized membrane protein